MFILPTVESLRQLYLSLAQSKYPDADISQFADFDAKANAAGGMQARQALDVYRYFNALYPQNGDSFGINSQLASGGVPSQYAATPTFVTADVSSVGAGLVYEIPVGTTLGSDNGTLYKVVSPDGTSQVIQITAAYPTLSLISVEKGTPTNIDIGATLTFSPPQLPTNGSNIAIDTALVTSTIQGVNEESLGSTINRLIEIKQSPLNGSRSLDFKYLAFDPTNGVNDAVVLTNNQLLYSSSSYNVAIFDVGGTPITNTILNKGLIAGTTTEVFDRSVPSGTYANTLQKIISEDICGVFPVCNTVNTQGLTTLTSPSTPFFKIKVTLQSGYALNSTIQVDGVSLSLYQLIQREVRRAICGQPFGAALEQNYSTGAYLSSSIATSSIEQQLDEALGTPTTIGTLGNYLSNRSILVYDGTDWVYQANIPLALGIPTTSTNPLQWVYDVSLNPTVIYSNISVELS